MVQNICGEAPLLDGHQIIQQRTANPALSWIRAVALAVIRREEGGQEMGASRIVETCEEEGIAIPGLKDDAPDAVKLQTAGRALGRVFKTANSVEVEGISCIRELRDGMREDGKQSKIYVFRL